MKTLTWPNPVEDGPAVDGPGEEFALVAGSEGLQRLLVVPALFEEANRTRRLLAQTMRALAALGIASVLPDLPGCNESLAPLERQNLASWRAGVDAAARHFRATHVLSLRGGALLAPPGLPGWRFEPLSGASALRQLVRARIVAAKEAGRPEKSEEVMARGRETGLELAGYRLGAAMVRDLAGAELAEPGARTAILAIADLGGSALWLRSEPGEDAAMAEVLAATIARGMA